MNNILTDGRNLCDMIENNCVFRFQQAEIYYIISANLITREETNISDLHVTEEVKREYHIKSDLHEWADDSTIENGETKEAYYLRKLFAADLVKSFPVFKKYFENINNYNLFTNIDYVVNNNLNYLLTNKENLTPGLADNVKKWVSNWRDKNEVRNTCHYFTYDKSQFPFFTDWGDYFFTELDGIDKKLLIRKIKENDFNILHGIEDNNENTTAIKLILSNFK